MIYYVEDDSNIRELSIYALKQAGIPAIGLKDAVQLRVALAKELPDVILLDIMLPETDGLELLKYIRETKAIRDIPVMMLTAKDTELDTVLALDAGADDYLTKPFGMMEMVSRVRALLRRSKRTHAATKQDASQLELCVGDLHLWPQKREVKLGETAISLTQREFDLLAYLMEAPGVVFSRDELLQTVWGWDFDGGTRTVDVHMQQLRSKLGEAAELLETVRGVGYRLRG